MKQLEELIAGAAESNQCRTGARRRSRASAWKKVSPQFSCSMWRKGTRCHNIGINGVNDEKAALEKAGRSPQDSRETLGADRQHHWQIRNMVANVNGPQFSGGAKHAIKCPSHTYEQTLAFYRDPSVCPGSRRRRRLHFPIRSQSALDDRVPNLTMPTSGSSSKPTTPKPARSIGKSTGYRVGTKWSVARRLRRLLDLRSRRVIHLVVGDEE